MGSLYLFKLGLAPQIQDLYGKVDFTGKAKHKPASALLISHFILNPDVDILQKVAENINSWSLSACLKRSADVFVFFPPAAFANVKVISSSSRDS